MRLLLDTGTAKDSLPDAADDGALRELRDLKRLLPARLRLKPCY